MMDAESEVETAMTIFEKVYEAVRLIPPGSVATYGQVAEAVGNRRLSRVVGYALHVNPDPDGIPCYRVVNRDGRPSPAFAFGGFQEQVYLLEKDGVEFNSDGNVIMEKYQWNA